MLLARADTQTLQRPWPRPKVDNAACKTYRAKSGAVTLQECDLHGRGGHAHGGHVHGGHVHGCRVHGCRVHGGRAHGGHDHGDHARGGHVHDDRGCGHVHGDLKTS